MERGYRALTREQFLFPQMRCTAGIWRELGGDVPKIEARIVGENLYRYPTQKSVRDIARLCLKRLQCLDSEALIEVLATGQTQESKQAALYAYMLQNPLVYAFMTRVVAQKYRTRDGLLTRGEIRAFLEELGEEDARVGTWSDSTMTRTVQELTRTLRETGYLDGPGDTMLHPVIAGEELSRVLRDRGDAHASAAFHCLN